MSTERVFESPDRFLRRLAGSFALLLLSLYLSLSCRRHEAFVDEAQQFSSLNSGPAFVLDGVPKEIHRLIVNFYAPDCPPCEKEIPALKKFYQKYRSQSSIGFIAVGSSLKAIEQNPRPGKDPPMSVEQIKAELLQFNRKYAPEWPQYLADGAALKTWRVTGFPETFVFIRQQNRWVLVKKLISEVTLETLEELINKNLTGERGGTGY